MSKLIEGKSKQARFRKNTAKENFKRELIDQSALSSNNIRAAGFNLENAKSKSANALLALDVHNGLQAMLTAQMLSIHELQQRTMTFANGVDNLELKKYYTNSGVKLANCFVQQANLLAKLQGIGQKITIERVDVHNGGQAIVGNVERGL